MASMAKSSPGMNATIRLMLIVLLKSYLNRKTFKHYYMAVIYEEICRRALKVVNSTNLIFPNEKWP